MALLCLYTSLPAPAQQDVRVISGAQCQYVVCVSVYVYVGVCVCVCVYQHALCGLFAPRPRCPSWKFLPIVVLHG